MVDAHEGNPLDAEPMAIIQTADAITAITRSEIDMQIATAKEYPRDMARVRDRVLELATVDEDTAASCFYVLKRETKVITGPSVRLAEIVAASYQNLRAASRIIGIDRNFVTCQGACHDLENNYARSAEVKRRITRRDGSRYGDDMIMVTSMAGGAIAFRNAVFSVVPKAIFKKIFDQIRKVAAGDEETLDARRSKLIEYYNQAWGVSQERVLAAVGKTSPEDVTIDDFLMLRGIAESLKEGATTPDQAFGAVAPVTDNKLAAGRHKAPGKAPAAKAPEPKGKGKKAGKKKAREKAAKAEAKPEPEPEAPAFDREEACTEIHDFLNDPMTGGDERTIFFNRLEGLSIAPDSWPDAGDGVLNALLSTVRDLMAGRA